MAHSDPERPQAQPGQREQQPAPVEKDDPHLAPESGDKPDAANPAGPQRIERTERGGAT